MGEGEAIVRLLESLFKQWSFLGVDVNGRSRGMTIRWKQNSAKILKYWGFESGMGVEACIVNLGEVLQILNFYGSYVDRVPFWEALLRKSFFQSDAIILGGDLNLSLGVSEVWGPRAKYDPLSDLFKHIIEEKGLSDLDPIKLMPTWRNKRTGEDRVMKRIDRFLLSDKIMDKSLHFGQWIGDGEDSNHFPIFLEVAESSKNLQAPSSSIWIGSKRRVLSPWLRKHGFPVIPF
jgi:hypothetical protein